MMSHFFQADLKEHDTLTAQSFFEIIYQAAKEKNLARIQAVLPYVSIDVIDGNHGAPVKKLALEGNIEAVNFLRTHFNASLTWIMCGYCQGGYFDEVSTIVKPLNPAFRLYSQMLLLASAYAEGGWVEEENVIMDICPLNSSERKSFLKHFAKGYASGGHVFEVNRILSSNPAFKTDVHFMEAVVYGYSHAGNIVEINKILKSSNPDDYFNLIKYAFKGYIQIGFLVQAYKLYRLISNPQDQDELLNEMIVALASTGQVKKVNEILMCNNNGLLELWKSAIYGFAKGGYFQEANKILCLATNDDERKFLQKEMALAFAYGEHFDKVNDILSMALDANERISLFTSISIGYSWSSNISKIQESFQSATEQERVAILKYTMYGYGSYGHIDEGKIYLMLAQTPAQRLSMVKQFLKGLAIEGHVNLANEILALERNFDEKHACMEWMAYGYAADGNFCEAKNLLDQVTLADARFKLLTEMVRASGENRYQAVNSYLDLAVDQTERNKLIELIVSFLKKQKVFTKNETLLPILVNFNPEYQNTIYEQAKDDFICIKLLMTGIRLNRVMHENKINYRQASAWIGADLQCWLLQGVLLIQHKKLSTETYVLITSCLSFMLKSEVFELSNKLSLKIGRGGFFSSKKQCTHSEIYDSKTHPKQDFKRVI
jgi:hypothetical protein